MYCLNCGEKNKEGANYCYKCGSDLQAHEKQLPSSTEAVITSSSPVQTEQEEGNSVPDSIKASESAANNTSSDGNYHPWRRFFARTFDLMTLGMLALIACVALLSVISPSTLRDFQKLLNNPIAAGFIVYLLYLPIEAGFLSFLGTTPGKWIFGIKVLKKTGENLTFSEALERVSQVWLRGDGLGIPLVALFTRIYSYNKLMKTGSTHWDNQVGSIVTHTSWGLGRAISSVIAVIAILLIYGILNSMGK